MSAQAEIWIDRSSERDVLSHLERCDIDFTPPLSTRLSLHDYAAKLVALARRVEAWQDDVLIGLAAIYCNAEAGGQAFISTVSVEEAARRQGLANRLVGEACNLARNAHMAAVRLELHPTNLAALRLYQRHGFTVELGSADILSMHLTLNTR